MQLKKLIFFLLILFVNLSSVHSQDSKREFPKEAKKVLYKNLYYSLKQLQVQNKTISISQLDGKFCRGKILGIKKNKMLLENYKGDRVVILFQNIKALYYKKIILDKYLKPDVLYYIGMISYSEQEVKLAKRYLKDSYKAGYKKAGKFLDKIKRKEEQIAAQKKKREEYLLKLKKEIENKEKARKEMEKKEESINKIIKISGDKKLDANKYIVKGKYSIFQFTASW